MSENQEILKKLPNLENFLNHCHRRRYPKQSTIIYAGETSDSLYYIIDGSVAVVLEDEDSNGGRETIVAFLNTGEFFGEMGLFSQAGARTAWVKTKSECEVAEISYAKFLELTTKDPSFFIALGSQMAKRLQETTRKVGDLTFLDVTGRIASAILELCNQPDAVNHDMGTQITITRQDISSLVGCSREMVGRVLKSLVAQGLIEVKGKTMVVYDPERIKEAKPVK